jgi:CBS domain-containing protein
VAQSIRDVMTPDPVALPAAAFLNEAARQMKQLDIGQVIVLDDNKVCGVVTDRDIVVRAVADNRDPTTTTLSDICSKDLVTLAPGDTVDAAVELMREHALRRLPIVENDRPVGVVSLGDLALGRDPHSALADISAAPANV